MVCLHAMRCRCHTLESHPLVPNHRYAAIVDLTQELNGAPNTPADTQAATLSILKSLFPPWLPGAFAVSSVGRPDCPRLGSSPLRASAASTLHRPNPCPPSASRSCFPGPFPPSRRG